MFEDYDTGINVTKCDDGSIWVTSDNDPIGIEIKFNKDSSIPLRDQILIATATFIGYEPKDVLNLNKYSDDD